MNNAVINRIKNKIGAENAKNYAESAPMFNAIIETSHKRDYFIESSQFTSSTGTKFKREYVLKFIGESNVSKIWEFNSKREAMEFFENAEFLPSGALILNRSLIDKVYFDSLASKPHSKRLYNDAYLACFSIWYQNRIESYCEGDHTILHCGSDEIFEVEQAAHVKYFQEC